MNTTATSRTHRTLQTLKRAWREMDYVQRRLIELRTGEPSSR